MKERQTEICITLKDGSKVILENVMTFYISNNSCQICFYDKESKDIKIFLNDIENLCTWSLSV